MSFLTDPTSSFWASKTNWRERPSVRTAQQWVSAEDLNQVRGALFDLKDAVNLIVPLDESYFPSDHIIYVRTTGSDVTGDGSILNPYASFARAMRDVPAKLDNHRYWLDVTGISELLPNDIQFPAKYGIPMEQFQTHNSSWDNIEFSGQTGIIYPPPAEFPQVSFAENLNIVSQMSGVYSLTNEVPQVSAIDQYSMLSNVTFGSDNFADGQFDGCFLANTNHPRLFVPIYKTVAPNSMQVAGDEDEIPLTGSGWKVVSAGADVTFVPGVTSASATPHAGIWLGGGTAGIHLHGIRFNRHPSLNIEAQWVLMEQGGSFTQNGCITNISGTNWGRNIVADGATFRAYQSFLNGVSVQGGSETSLVSVVVQGDAVKVQTGSYGSSRAPWTSLVLREVILANGSQINNFGINPGSYILRNVIVKDQAAQDIGSDEPESLSRNSAVTLLNFTFENASGSADVSVLNNWATYMSGGNIQGSLLVSEESHVIARGVNVLNGVELNDGSICETYGCTIGTNPLLLNRVYVHNDSNFSMKGGRLGDDTTVYSYDRSTIYLSRITASYTAELTGTIIGAYFTSQRNSELILRSPYLTSSLSENTGTFPQLKYGEATASLSDLFSIYKLESTDLGHAGSSITWVP